MTLLMEPVARLERALGNGEDTPKLIALLCKYLPAMWCCNTFFVVNFYDILLGITWEIIDQ